MFVPIRGRMHGKMPSDSTGQLSKMTPRLIEDAWKKCMPLGLRDMCLMCLHYAGVQCWV